jgi:hypothetical protein
MAVHAPSIRGLGPSTRAAIEHCGGARVGLLGGQLGPGEVRGELPWHRAVQLPERDEEVMEVSEALAITRAVRST